MLVVIYIINVPMIASNKEVKLKYIGVYKDTLKQFFLT